jgi:hypothetical protein
VNHHVAQQRNPRGKDLLKYPFSQVEKTSSFAENVIHPAKDFVLASRRKGRFASVPDNSEPGADLQPSEGGSRPF